MLPQELSGAGACPRGKPGCPPLPVPVGQLHGAQGDGPHVSF